MGVGFENTCERLYGWVYKILRLVNITADYRVVVVTAGCQSVVSQSDSRGWSIFDSYSTKLVLGSSGGIKFVILVEDFDNGGQS